MKMASPWIVRPAPRAHASMRLFCLPHAGASSVIFREWFGSFSDSVEVCAVEPPGRLARRNERAYGELAEFTEALEAAILPYLDLPFAFFGHSLGALMAFECARALRRHHQLEATHLIVAAHKAPQVPWRQRPLSREPKNVFVRELEQRYGPLEPALKAEPELLDMLVDIMRVDLGMLERYRYQDEKALNCPILAIGGTADESLAASDLQAWQHQTANKFRLEWMAGGHFFLRERGRQLRELLRSELGF